MSPPCVPLNAIRQPAILYDTEGRIVAANDLAEALAGRPRDGLFPVDVAVALSVRKRDGVTLAPDARRVTAETERTELILPAFEDVTGTGRERRP